MPLICFTCRAIDCFSENDLGELVCEECGTRHYEGRTERLEADDGGQIARIRGRVITRKVSQKSLRQQTEDQTEDKEISPLACLEALQFTLKLQTNALIPLLKLDEQAVPNFELLVERCWFSLVRWWQQELSYVELVEAFTSITRNRYSKKEGDAESETEDERAQDGDQEDDEEQLELEDMTAEEDSDKDSRRKGDANERSGRKTDEAEAERNKLEGRSGFRGKFSARAQLRPRLPVLLAILFYCCRSLRLPIVPSFLLSFVLNGELPYFGSFSMLPAPLQRKVRKAREVFRPRRVVSSSRLSLMMEHISSTLGLSPPPPYEVMALGAELVYRLGLPSTVLKKYEQLVTPAQNFWEAGYRSRSVFLDKLRPQSALDVMALIILSTKLLPHWHKFAYFDGRTTCSGDCCALLPSFVKAKSRDKERRRQHDITELERMLPLVEEQPIPWTYDDIQSMEREELSRYTSFAETGIYAGEAGHQDQEDHIDFLRRLTGETESGRGVDLGHQHPVRLSFLSEDDSGRGNGRSKQSEQEVQRANDVYFFPLYKDTVDPQGSFHRCYSLLLDHCARLLDVPPLMLHRRVRRADRVIESYLREA